MSVPILSPWLARNGPKEWCCCRRGPTCLGPLSLTGPMGMSGAGAQSQLLCGRGTLQRVEQKPRPRLAMVFLEEFSVLFSVLIMWTSCYCHPPGWAGGGGLSGHLAPFIGHCPEIPLGSPPFFPPESWLCLPPSSRSGTVGQHRARVSVTPPAYTQMGTHPTSQREGPGALNILSSPGAPSAAAPWMVAEALGSSLRGVRRRP